jgi:sarcosine oxidase gamma subunit
VVGGANPYFFRSGPPAYAFAVRRSFAASFYEWPFAVAAKYGVLVRPA